MPVESGINETGILRCQSDPSDGAAALNKCRNVVRKIDFLNRSGKDELTGPNDEMLVFFLDFVSLVINLVAKANPFGNPKRNQKRISEPHVHACRVDLAVINAGDHSAYLDPVSDFNVRQNHLFRSFFTLSHGNCWMKSSPMISRSDSFIKTGVPAFFAALAISSIHDF